MKTINSLRPAEFFVDLPYRIPNRTVKQRLCRVFLFPLVFVLCIPMVLVCAILVALPIALLNYVIKGEQE